MKPCGKSDDCLHVTCEECDKLIRKTSHLLADHPGTVKGAETTRLCATHRNSTKHTPYDATPKECLECGRPLRPGGTLLKDHPGTVQHGAHGLCTTHYRVRSKDPTLDEHAQYETNKRGLQKFLEARYEREIKRRRAILIGSTGQ